MAKMSLPREKSGKKIKAKGIKVKRKMPEIVIDEKLGLVFDSEQELYSFFEPFVQKMESQYATLVQSPEKFDFSEKMISDELEKTLDEPAEIWLDEKTFKEFPIFHFIRPLADVDAFHVVTCYVSSDEEPTFIFLNFFSRELKVVSKFQRGDLIYDRAFDEVGFGALEGDSLMEGDPMAMGLFLSMLKVRQEGDVAFEKFKKIGEEVRDDTIQTPDEIWRSTGARGVVLVTFIRAIEDHLEKDLHYVVVTQEDEASHTHSLLFSFPTNDMTLVDRYRHGENLQTEEVAQESSH